MISARGQARLAHAVSAVALAGTLTVCTACTAATGGHGTPGRTTPSPASTAASGPTSSAAGTNAPGAAGGRPSAAPIAFGACTDIAIPQANFPPARFKELRIDCGRLTVPLDYRSPGGPTTGIAVIRIHSTNQRHPTGSLLINPGGPGGSGVSEAVGLATRVAEPVLDAFDLIGFDPRGVGLSGPAKCLTGPVEDQLLAADPDVRTPDGLAADRALYRRVAEDCSTKYGTALAHYDSEETARDMDLIRQGVGDEAMNYLGFSYGTELGALYAHLFPTTVRAEVLDGAVDPSTWGSLIGFLGEQLKGFEDAYGQFADWCRRQATCRQLGDPKQTLLDLQARADAHPLPARGGRSATGGTVQLAAIEALYSEQLWPSLADALLAGTRGDGSGLLQLVDEYADRRPDGTYDALLDVYITVTCNDEPLANDPTDDQIERTATTWAQQYPLFWRTQAAALAQCTDWQRDRHPVPDESARGARPILVVGNVNDPATPYVGAQRLTATLGSATLLTLDGQGHTSYLSSGCIESKVNDYLINGTVPAPGTTCSQ